MLKGSGIPHPANCDCDECRMELAYLAGFFDGEGSIHIGLRRGVQVNAAQVDETPLLMLVERFGGTVARQPRGANRPVSYWKIYGQPAIVALNRMAPYLVVKRRQVEIATAFRALAKPLGHNSRLTPQDRMDREELMTEMDALHHAR